MDDGGAREPALCPGDDGWLEALASADASRPAALVLRGPARATFDEVRGAVGDLLVRGFTVAGAEPGGVTFRPGRHELLYLGPWVKRGGSDRGTLDWLRTIDRERFGRALVTTQPSDNPWFGEAERLADAAWHLPDRVRGREMPGFVARVVRDRGVAAVHVMNSKLGFDLLPDLERAFPHVGVVVQLHNLEVDGRGRPWGYVPYVISRFDRHVDAYSVISRDVLEAMVERGVPREKLHLVPLGVDVDDEFRPRAPGAGGRREGTGETFRVLFPARLTEQKDPLLLVEIAAGLAARGSGAVVDVVGEGALGAELERAVSRRGLGDRFVFHGAHDDMAAWYERSDVTVLTSRYEGLPMTVQESLACEVPVVAAAVGAIPELVDASCGVLVEPRDDVDAYVEALVALERDPERRRRLGIAGRERLLRAGFTTGAMARAHEDLYVEVVAARVARLLGGEPEGRRDGESRAVGFEGWTPPGTVPCGVRTSSGAADLVVSEEVVKPLARLYREPFEDTAPLVRVDAGRFRVGGGDRLGHPDAPGRPDGEVVGHVLRHHLPGLVDLSRAVSDALREAGCDADAIVVEGLEGSVEGLEGSVEAGGTDAGADTRVWVEPVEPPSGRPGSSRPGAPRAGSAGSRALARLRPRRLRRLVTRLIGRGGSRARGA